MSLNIKQLVMLEELGPKRVKKLMAQRPGSSREDQVPLDQWYLDFQAEKKSWPWYKRLGYRLGLVH